MLEILRNATKLFTVEQVAEILECHVDTVYKSARKGKMPHIRVGGRIKFDGAKLADYLERGVVSAR